MRLKHYIIYDLRWALYVDLSISMFQKMLTTYNVKISAFPLLGDFHFSKVKLGSGTTKNLLHGWIKFLCWNVYSERYLCFTNKTEDHISSQKYSPALYDQKLNVSLGLGPFGESRLLIDLATLYVQQQQK